MITFLDNFISVWTYWMIPSFILGLVGFCFLFYVRWGSPTNKKKSLKIGISLFGQTFLTWTIMFGTLWIIERQARHELKTYLNQPNLTISLNGQIINKIDSDSIVKELIRVTNMQAHHSHTTDIIKIEITSTSKTEIIRLEKDSEIENEYWIFWDKYKSTSKNEIGRIRTNIFKKNNGI